MQGLWDAEGAPLPGATAPLRPNASARPDASPHVAPVHAAAGGGVRSGRQRSAISLLFPEFSRKYVYPVPHVLVRGVSPAQKWYPVRPQGVWQAFA